MLKCDLLFILGNSIWKIFLIVVGVLNSFIIGSFEVMNLLN